MWKIAENKIIIYGAGCCGAMFAELLQKSGLIVESFFDKNPAKEGKQIMGIPIQKPTLLGADSLVVVCILMKGGLYKEISQELSQLGYQKIFHIYDLREETWLFRSQNIIFSPDQKQVRENFFRYRNLKESLSDDLSCKVVDCVLEFLLKDADVEFPALSIEKQYFAYDVYQKISEEYVVDCGAFKGEVLRIFLAENQNEFAHYLAIEPDSSYLDFLQFTADQYIDGKIEIINCAVSDRQEQLRMRNYAGENSVVCSDGEIQVQAWPLDELLKGKKCTFLKIDVEGYDKKAILGAAELIQEQKPVVAVAVYHQESEFYEIFELLQELYEGYHFYLRSYMNIQETILYAVPPQRLVEEEKNEIFR